jgi:hypothetical protein
MSMRSRLTACAALVAASLALLLAADGGATTSARAATFTGYGFEACNAPSFDSLDSWLESPYRAVGIYIGGIDRSCSNAQLTADWVSSALADGWSLIPTYVGLQAPCISNTSRAHFTAANAESSGTSAADDAIADAVSLGLPTGSPIYFDMEAYAVKNPACTQAVQTFVSAWDAELHSKGWVAGVYGSASSTARDLQALETAGTGPDDVWIANWNGNEAVFGDPYVSDDLWTNHQRIHQYRGGHKETYGGVTINIDSDFVDGAVVSASAASAGVTSQAGATSTTDGVTSATWSAAAFTGEPAVTVTSIVPGATLPGYGSGGYGVQLTVADADTQAPVTSFAAPVTLTITPQTGTLAPVYSQNGTTWKHVPLLVGGALAQGGLTGYTRQDDGSVQLQTLVAGTFALVPDRTRPSAPVITADRLADRQLAVRWSASTDDNGPIAAYRVTLTNEPVASTTPGVRRDAVAGFHAGGPSVFRVVAVDAAGNESRPSKPIVVLPSKRPATVPKAIPGWSWKLFDWLQAGRSGSRPATAPKSVPAWFWTWSSWRTLPFHLRGF